MAYLHRKGYQSPFIVKDVKQPFSVNSVKPDVKDIFHGDSIKYNKEKFAGYSGDANVEYSGKGETIGASFHSDLFGKNDRRGLNTYSGMRRAKKEGRWVSTAPIGYKNFTAPDGKRKYIAPDPEVAPLVVWVFEQLATGQHTVMDVFHRAKHRGLKCSKNNVWMFIRNPVYCGKIVVPATEDESATLVKGLHEPIISEELFYAVQDVLDGRKRNVPTKNTRRDELPLRGFLLCRQCGNQLTGSASTGRLGRRYFYYHCQKGCTERFKAGKANQLFVDGLESFTVKKEAIDLYYLAVKKAFGVNKGNVATELASIKREIETLQSRIEKARNLMLDDKIDASDYRETKENLQPKIEKLSRRLGEFTSIDGDFKNFVEDGFGLLRNLSETYSNAELSQKQQIIGSIFPEKLVFENNQYRTPKLLRAFARILCVNGVYKGHKKRTEAIFLPQSTKVAPLGLASLIREDLILK
jgi:hypothetical protein